MTLDGNRVIDAHLHLWDLTVSDYGWLGPQHGPVHATFTAADAHAHLAAAGVDAAVLVQAEDSEADTAYLLDQAAGQPWISGVVGWVALDDPARAARQLERWRRSPYFRGVRHLVHDDPRDDFLALRPVRDSLRLLAECGIPFDVPDAWPRHLTATAELAAALPGLTIVVDHLAKPPRGRDDYPRWREALREVARRPNTVAKVSGLQWPDQPLTAAALRPVWETALELFGPDRLMYGGDWPMTLPYGGYAATWRVLAELIAELAPAERARVLAGTATEVYGIGGPD
ncbi:L-fuconolactonase [Prauserella shujinwangii]|uniref:L-fuconolactonase n=1 Tax=Prauserella shujinwangii TaxID=1453103 RepID=A0A2T0LYI9_9PSEU|nr:amidohydrolase family protein [Prauserella shujinwangii]PRX49188.1 L-fuconolactonase [Prauserella shujinwangii]